VVVIAIGLIAGQFALPRLIEVFGDSRVLRLLTAVVALIACSPFLLALELKAPKRVSIDDAAPFARLRSLQPGILIVRSAIGLGLIAFIIGQFATTVAVPLLVLVATPILLLAFRKPMEPFYLAVERRFMQNLTAKERAELESLSQIPQLAPWNATLTRFVLTSDSQIAGKTLEESKFRTSTGATVVMIDRGRRRIFSPTRWERLLPNDQIFLIGTDDQLTAAQAMLEAESEQVPSTHDESFNLESVLIAPHSPYAGKTIRELAMPERLGALVVGIERGSIRMLNPESTTQIELNDQIWVFGRRDKIRELRSTASP